MRSSKSRSRSKANRPRTLGNIINRVFDSSGPEGKVRGTPQQLIEKYQQLGRDAQLSNDRVAAENFMQHSEHYTRLLSEAMREMAAEQEARAAQQPMQQGQPYNGNNNSNNPRNDRPDYRNDRGESGQQHQPRFDQPRGDGARNDAPRNDAPRDQQPRQENRPDTRGDKPRQDRRDERRDDRRPVPNDVVSFAEADEETGLVETPEARRAPVFEAPPGPMMIPADELNRRDEGAKRARAPRRPRADADAPVSAEPASDKPAKPRGPAKPREAAE